MKKRVFAAVLTLCLLAGLLPTTAWAVGALSITQQPAAENNYTVTATYMGQEMDQGFQWYKKAAAVTTYTLVQENPQAGELAVDTVNYGSYTDGHWASGDDRSPLSVSFLSSPGDEVTVTVLSGGDTPDGTLDGRDITFTGGSSGVYTATSTGGMLDIYIDNSERTSPVTATITVKRCWAPLADQTSASLTASESGTYYCAVSKEGEGAITNTVQVVVPHGSHPVCGKTCTHTGPHDNKTWTELTPEMVNNTGGSAYALTNKNYYLTDSFETDKSFTVSGNVNLCFNGHTITCRAKNPCANAVGGGSSSQLLINSGAVFNVCDCQGNGGFTRDLSTLTQRDKYMRVLMAENTCTINLYGGTFTGDNGYSFSSFENTALTVDGAVLTGYCNLNLLSNCTLVFQSGNVNCSDTAIMLQGTVTVTILGGTIYGKTYGVYLGPSNSLTLSGSPNITGGTAGLYCQTTANATLDNAKVDATNYNGSKLSVKESATTNSPLSSKVGAYAIKGGEGKFTLTNTCYKYAYENGGMVIREDHNWATTWSSDGNYHWHNCNNTGCPITDNTQKNGYAAHTAVTDPAVPATCTTPGKTEGSHCSVCQYVITAQTAVPATGNHTYPGYEKNDTQHWQKCTVCQTETAKADHVYDNDQDTKCDTCGYIRTIAPSHTHEWDTGWSTDESGHWHKCNAEDCTITNYAECGQTDAAYAAHTEVTDPAVPATCGAAGKTEGSHCSVCQYVITAQTAVPATGNHTYPGYEKNDTQHWQKCTVCQTETAKADHAGGTAACTAKAVCTTCGQSYGELAAHDFTGNYLSDADGHWHKCQNCTATDAKAAHVYDNGQDTTCDACGYIRTTAPSHTHAWAGDWTAGGTHHWHECTAAGCPIADSAQKDGFAAHTEDSGTVTKPATNTEKGVKTFKCTVCSRVLRTEDIPVLTYSISGVVTEKKDSQQESALGGVELKLMQGNTQVGQTITTGSDGKYSFSNVPAGTYNVVAEQGSGDSKITKTILVVLTDSDATEKNITMPDGKKNSLVEIKGSDTPAAVAGGVDEVAEDQQVEPGQTVTVKLTVEKKAESAVSSDATAIKQVAGGKTVEFLDLSLVKEVMGGSNPGTTNITDTSGRVLEIVLPYDFSGKQNVAVYRYHGGSAQALTRADTGAGGTFKLGADSVIIYATKFSTYAIGYTASGSETPDPTPPTSIPPSGGGSGSPATYSPVIETSGRGKVEVKPRNPEQGDKVTVTLAPDKNWQAGGLTVTDQNGKPAAVTDKGGGAYTFIQPNGKVTIQAVFRPDGGYETCLKNSECPIWPYTDAGATAWYHDGVHYCLDRSLMVGLDEHTFAPDADTSRAMVAAILWRLEGSPAVNYVLPFDDVAEGAWYTQAVRWAAASGVVSGYGGGSFGPGDPVTREQLAAILYRYEQYKGGGFTGAWMFPLDFEDAGQVSDWAHEPMCWMTMKGIIGGIGDKLLDPGGRATRAQAAAMLMRFCTKT